MTVAAALSLLAVASEIHLRIKSRNDH